MGVANRWANNKEALFISELRDRQELTVTCGIDNCEEQVPVEVPVLTREEMAQLARFEIALGEGQDKVAAAYEAAMSVASALTAKVDAAVRLIESGAKAPPPAPAPAPRPAPPKLAPAARESGNGHVEPPPAPVPQPGVYLDPTPAQQKILDAIAWWRAVGVYQPSIGQVAFLVGYHARSKGFTNNVSALSSGGFIVRSPGKLVELTTAGIREAREPAATPTDDELQRMIFEQIGAKRAEMLAYLIEKAPDFVPMEQLAGFMGYHERSKGFTNNVSSLSGLGLVDRAPGKKVRASALCFVGELVPA